MSLNVAGPAAALLGLGALAYFVFLAVLAWLHSLAKWLRQEYVLRGTPMVGGGASSTLA